MNPSPVFHRIFPAIAMAGLCHVTIAENICTETVPANRHVDSIPAYAQCSASSASVYSNNGIDTRATSGGAGWVRTQGSGGYQCTEFAHRYLRFRWNILSVPSGNAGSWCGGTMPVGVEKTTMPVHGDIIVFAPGSCGASTTSGHVAVVDLVGATSVTIVEQNGAARRTCAISCASCFLHVVANNGIAGVRVADVNRDATKFGVHQAEGRIAIQLNGGLKQGASVRVFDLCGRQMVDLTDCMESGRASCSIAGWSAGTYVISVQKAGRGFSRKVVVGERP